jgi:mannose-6-phosphate isomerase-like protein (cupin superfamily)
MTGIEFPRNVVDASGMTEEILFSGKLVKQRLPDLKPGEGVELPVLKRLILPQGMLAQFHDSEEPARYIAALELVTGTVRGNHHHHTKVEHVYLMRGALELIAEDVETGQRTQLAMKPGDLVVIQPGVAHAFRVIQEGVAIEFAPTRFDPADSHRHVVA